MNDKQPVELATVLGTMPAKSFPEIAVPGGNPTQAQIQTLSGS